MCGVAAKMEELHQTLLLDLDLVAEVVQHVTSSADHLHQSAV